VIVHHVSTQEDRWPFGLRYDQRRAKAGMILRMALSFPYKWFTHKSDKFRDTKKLYSFSQGG
jgi:hypothetical protein